MKRIRFFMAALLCLLCGCRARSEAAVIAFPKEPGRSFLHATARTELDSGAVSVTFPTVNVGQENDAQSETLEDGCSVSAYYSQEDGMYAVVTPAVISEVPDNAEELPEFPGLSAILSEMDGQIYAAGVTDGTLCFDVWFCRNAEFEPDRVTLQGDQSIPLGFPREEFISRLAMLGISEFFSPALSGNN